MFNMKSHTSSLSLSMTVDDLEGILFSKITLSCSESAFSKVFVSTVFGTCSCCYFTLHLTIFTFVEVSVQTERAPSSFAVTNMVNAQTSVSVLHHFSQFQSIKISPSHDDTSAYVPDLLPRPYQRAWDQDLGMESRFNWYLKLKWRFKQG